MEPLCNSAAGSLPPAERAPLQGLAGKLASRTLEALVVSYLNAELPSLATTLAVLGVVDMAPQRGQGLDVSYVPVEPVAPRLYLDRVSQLLQQPDQYLRQTFNWGDPAFDGATLLRKLQALLESFSLPAGDLHPAWRVAGARSVRVRGRDRHERGATRPEVRAEPAR